MSISRSTGGASSVIARSGQPAAAFEELATHLKAQVGYVMLTVTFHDMVRSQARRVYSSSPSTHPTSAFKPVDSTDWVEQVMVRQENFVGNSVAAYWSAYADSARLEEMGIRSACNFPIVIDGTAVGSVNLTSDQEGYYTPERMAAGDALADVAAIAILLQERAERSAA